MAWRRRPYSAARVQSSRRLPAAPRIPTFSAGDHRFQRGRLVGAGDVREERKGHDLAGGRVIGADLAQPPEGRAGHGPGVYHDARAAVRARGSGQGPKSHVVVPMWYLGRKSGSGFLP